MKEIPYSRQTISEDDILAVNQVLRSDMITQGPVIAQFERAIADYCGVQFAVAVSSATAALHLAVLAAELKSGQRLWTSPNTFVASANSSLYCGGLVDFVDIDSKTYNMDVGELEKKLLTAKTKGALPQIVMAVHFAGQSCKMDRIQKLSQEHGFTVIEDASHCIGGKYRGKPVGSCQFSKMTVFSFHAVKIMTTGEGGLITTNDKETYERLLRLRTHGITRDPKLMVEKPDGPWSYQQVELGYNYRITDFQAALGLSQFKKLDEFVQTRHQLVKRYDEALQDLPLTLPWQHPDSYSALHLYPVCIKKLKKSRLEIYEELRRRGIGVNVHYIPVHLQPYYKKFGFKVGDFPVAEKYYSEALSLPLYSSLKIDEQNRVISTLREVLL